MRTQENLEVEYVPYTVVAGDSLFEISKRFAVPLSEIEAANDYPDPKRLQVGSVIMIPRIDGAKLPTNEPPQSISVPPVPRLNRSSGSTVVQWPLNERNIISPFGWRHSRFHEGLDLKAPSGTQIHAAHSGVVAYCGSRLSGYGNTIIVKANDLVTVYGHNRRNLVSPGQRVERGDIIGEVGSSGNASGPHLHFETRVPTARGAWQAVNPLSLLEGY